MTKTLEIESKDALALCSRAEGDLFDRKSTALSGRNLEKIAVALANADGGEIIIGIMDDKDEPVAIKRWQGMTNQEDFNHFLQCLFSLNPTVDFQHQFLLCKELPGVIMRVVIEISSDVCKTSRGTVYLRKGASSLPIKDPNRITALSFAKGATSYENSTLPNVRAELITETNEIINFTSNLTPPQEPLAYCINEQLIDYDDFTPKVAGLLLFSENPQASFPRRCAVKVLFYDTKEITPERAHLKHNAGLEGPLKPLISKAVDEVSQIMSGISINTPEGMKKVDYPPEAIWEIIANAVIHRDYSISDDIQVTIFQNRLEVKSPGRLPGFVTVDNFLDTRYSRNPKIVRTLAKYKDAPNKDLGEGLNTAFEKMKEWKLQSPQLTEEANYVVVTLPHTPLASPDELVLEFLSSYPEIRNRDAREITGIRSENQMKEIFYRMRNNGLIERVPGKHGKSAAWRKII